MGSLYPAGERRSSSRGALANGVTRMMTNSMVVYFAANFMHRILGASELGHRAVDPARVGFAARRAVG